MIIVSIEQFHHYIHVSIITNNVDKVVSAYYYHLHYLTIRALWKNRYFHNPKLYAGRLIPG